MTSSIFNSFKHKNFFKVCIYPVFLLGLSFLTASPVFASSHADGYMLNQFPLQVDIFSKAPKTGNLSSYIQRKGYTIPNFVDDVVDWSGTKPSIAKFRQEKFNYEAGDRWHIYSRPYLADPLGKPGKVYRSFEYTVSNNNVVLRHDSLNKGWKYCNTSNKTQPLRRYSGVLPNSNPFSSWPESSFPFSGMYSFGAFTTGSYAELQPNKCSYAITPAFKEPLYNFVNTFEVEYPDNYSGDIFWSEVQVPATPLKPRFHYRLRGNVLISGSTHDSRFSSSYWDKMKIRFELFKVVNDNEEHIVNQLLPVTQNFTYNFPEDSPHVKYYLAVTYDKGENEEADYNFLTTTVELNYKGAQTDITGYSDPLSPPLPEKPEFEYKHCDALDIGCHLDNFGTKIREIFTGFFVPNSSIIKSDFDDLKKSFDDKLGFLGQSFNIIISFFSSLISNSSNCYFSFNGTGGWLFASGLSFNFCDLQSRVPALVNFLFVFVRGTLVFTFVAMFFNKIKGVLRS